MERRRRPFSPSPCNTPVPDKVNNSNEKCLPYSFYMRPWTLHAGWASEKVSHITDLDVYPASQASLEQPALVSDTELFRNSLIPVESIGKLRNHEESSRWYMHGHVVRPHTQRLIVQFMATCCGRSSSGDDPCDEDEGLQSQLNAWKKQRTIEQEAQCARCYAKGRADIKDDVQYKCS